jgi:hypothetical protein
MTPPPRTVVVTGDVTIDWLLLSHAPRKGAALDFNWMWGSGYAGRALASAGGAASHAAILRHTVRANGLSAVNVVGATVPRAALSSPRHPSYAHTFADIEQFPRELGETGTAWRIAEFKGTDPARRQATAAPPPEVVDTILIVDHAIGYRDHHPDLDGLLAAGPETIVWQTGAPLAGSSLAGLLLDEHADRLTVLTSSDELRKAGLQVGYPLSWERIAEDVISAVRSHPLAKARRAIVIIGAAGALIVERDGDDVLVFDPRHQEGDWGTRFPGVGAGYGRCLDAAVTLELTAGDREEGLVGAVKRGLAAARAAHMAGFQVEGDGARPGNPFPLDAVAKALRGDGGDFASIVYRPARGDSILAQTYPDTSIAEVAATAAVHGVDSLPYGIPVERVGAWSSVDRAEIESLRGLRNILGEYVEQESRGMRRSQGPLPIAVFGPPGAGKTFAVRQLATVLLPGRIRRLEYDLSQMHGPAALHAAFHEIRDVALRGDLALVFWDEFDCTLDGQRLGWLRHFLSPMAEGRFHGDTGFHPIGPAIFVFAGGTAQSFDEFVAFQDEPAERAAKKPDFVSRLRGFVNVAGINRRNARDVTTPLRRALMLRSLIASHAPLMLTADGHSEPRMQIDEGVLRAFLETGEYIHGARSMEAILQMSSLAGKPRFERSSLPAPQQLAIHVDAGEFLALVQGPVT